MIENVKLIQVIKIVLSKGDGTINNPYRMVAQFWDNDKFLCEKVIKNKDDYCEDTICSASSAINS